MAGRRRSRRSEAFKVRRWLQMGAASAGMGAAMWGMSLVGPQVGVALADDGGAPSASADSSAGSGYSKTAEKQQKSDTATSTNASSDSSATDDDGKPDTDESDVEADNKDTGDSDDDSNDVSDAADTDGAETDSDETDSDETDSDETDSDETGNDSESVGAGAVPPTDASTNDDGAAAGTSVIPVSTLVPSPSATPANTEDDLPSAVAAPSVAGDPWGVKQEADEVNPWQQNTSDIIAATTSNVELVINSLPVPPELRDALNGTLWTMRRSFFNLAPTMDETFLVSSGLGAIEGRASATDSEGDQIQYRVVQGPLYGTVTLDAEGRYIYTPTEDFDGVDTFVIAATDLGLHLNLLEPFRAAGASASLLVNQNAIDFDFTYNDPDGYFTEEAKEALYQSAKRLSVYFIVNQKTVLTYTVNGEYKVNDYLAAAGSDPTSTDPGFWGTVVQEKLINGVDANGEEADGEIDWNWAYDWGYYPEVGSDQYDFTSTAMHELLHSFGWLAGFSSPANTERDHWYTYSQFVTTKEGDSPINDETYLWNSDFDPYLTGYGGGMFFSGADAMAAYGGRPVPLWTPTEWSGGSSISHLDDDTFSGPNHLMMDSAAASMGRDNIALSAIELGVLMDLGYTVAPAPWFAYPPVATDPEPEDPDLDL
jgi:hypothetical protein